MGVLPGLETSEATSEPSLLPTTSTMSSPFIISLLPERTLSGLLNTRGEGVPEAAFLGLFRSGSPSFPLGRILRFLLFVFLPCSCCSRARFSACLARTARRMRNSSVMLLRMQYYGPHSWLYYYTIEACSCSSIHSHLVSISSSSNSSDTISLGFRASGLKSPPEITILWICRAANSG